MNRKFPIYLLIGFVIASVLYSCKEDEDYTVDFSGATSSSTAVTSFSLLEDNKIMTNLDSVFFTIDMENGQIYNAEPLPVGTDVSKLRVSMTYAACHSAEFHVIGGKVMKDSTFVYSEEDSIDFTGDVKFTIISQDLSAKQVYDIKVNVYDIEPDTLYWDEMARTNLPTESNMDMPRAQKTVQYKEDLYCLIKDAKGYLLSTTSNPGNLRWERARVNFEFEPNMNTFAATDKALYILDTENKLYSSVDGLSWNACGETWHSILGSYGDLLLGIVKEDGVYKHTEYPASEGFVPYEVEQEFPVSGVSQMITLSSKWAVNDQRLMVGGITAKGLYTGMAWGYDGNTWGVVSRKGLPGIKGATLFSYYYTYFSADAWKIYEIPVLVAMGGVHEDGRTLNDVVYISSDRGVTWEKASSSMQLPDYIPDFTNAQAFVYNSTLTDSRSGSEGWTMMPAGKLPASLCSESRATEPVTSWECPYVYLFGGTTASGTLHNNVWRGVINRLTFKPLY